MGKPLHSDVSPVKRPSNGSGGKVKMGIPTGQKGTLNMKGANWPGLPGPTQPRKRGSDPKVKSTLKSEGI